MRWPRFAQLDAAHVPEVVIISGHGTIEAAVRATKLGAYDFLEKPLSLARTLIVLKNAMQARQMREDNAEFSAAACRPRARSPGNSRADEGAAPADQADGADQRTRADLRRERHGQGADRARDACAESLRKDRVFVELNCAAIPEDYIETELFGYRHGAAPVAAAPGVPAEKRGTFERADGGTLFLDEVGDMSLKTQAKVLRALDEQRFLPVGASHPVHVDVRVIAATNKDLEEEIARGNFREDLFYRLNVIPFFVPPLRDRKEDIPLLVKEFLAEFGAQYGRPRVEMTRRCAGRAEAVSLAGQRARAAQPDGARADPEPQGAAHRAQASADAGLSRVARRRARQQARRRRVRHAAGGARGLRARLHPEEDRRVPRQREPRGGGLGLERSHLYRKMKALGVSVKDGAPSSTSRTLRCPWDSC